MSESGVSVIICCHNSAGRLQPTLQALSKQKYSTELKWEILIIDNASNDNTSLVAQKIWNSFKSKPVVNFQTAYEPLPGLANARKRGIALSAYQYVLFCDDDNWLAPDYLQGVYNILNQNSLIAACGGRGVPVFESEKPFWFDVYEEAFAVGPQSINEENDVLLSLYGAGMAMNKNALKNLELTKYQTQMTGRMGKQLSSAEDTELTYAFVLMGYKLRYASHLRFSHYLPEERLEFGYVKKLFTAFGTDGPVRNLFYAHLSNRFFHRLIKNWIFHLLLSFFRFIKYLVIPPKKYGRIIYYNWNVAYLKQLFRIRKKYKSINENILLLKSGLPPVAPVNINREDYELISA